MADYTKVFDGAAKDTANATVLGADHDTEFNAIASAISTKMDKVAGATNGNLAELDADGNLVDSGIASANLDGLSAVVETRLDGHDTSISTINTNITNITPPAQPTNYSRGYWYNQKDGSQATTAFDLATNITESTFESVGPTGSGATNIWTELDALPSSARIAILNIDIQITISTGEGYGIVWGVMGGITGLMNNSSALAYVEKDADSGDKVGLTVQAFVPLDSSQVMQLTWESAQTSAVAINAYLVGYINDSA